MLAAVPLGTGAGADPTFVAGSGRARANLFEIIPRTGGLEIPINFGKALVTYQGLSATATSGGLKPPSQNAADGGCGGGFQPPGGGGGGGGGGPAPPKPPGGGNGPSTTFPWVSTVSVQTGDKDAEKGRQFDQGHFPDGSPISGRLEHQEVQATGAPAGRAATTHGRLGFGPLIEVVNGRTEAETGIVDGKTRLAHAVTTMDRLTIAGGLVSLSDVRWEATQRTGEGAMADGTFTVGSVLFQGKPLPAPPAPPAPPAMIPGGSAPTLPDPLAALNTALAPTGLVLVAPKFDGAGGVARVSPMSLRIADSALGRVVLAPLVTSLQPLRDPVYGGLLAMSCDFGTAVTVADVATGVLTGTGGVAFDFGGVSATTEGEAYDNPFAGGVGDGSDLGDGGFGDGGEVPGLPEIPSSSTAFAGPSVTDGGLPSVDTGGNLGFGGSGGTPSASGSVPSAGANSGAAGNPAGDEAAFSDPGLLGSTSRHEPGSKGGRALAVAALALLVVAALAAADAFHLRRASRSIS